VSEAISILAVNLGLLVGAFLVLWLLSMAIRDVSFIDGAWGLGLAAMGIATFVQRPEPTVQGILLTGLVAVWGIRLGLYLLWRWRQHGADRRYVDMLARAEAKNESWGYAAGMIFLVQAIILFVVSLPVQLGQIGTASNMIGILGWAGAGLAAFGILFESLADWQMARFKANPANAGAVMEQGLWRYTRHPNYFGDLCVWFGLWLLATGAGWLGLAAVIGPLLLLSMFLKVSGGSLYEGRLKSTRPGYEAYLARTSPLIPWPPKRG